MLQNRAVIAAVAARAHDKPVRAARTSLAALTAGKPDESRCHWVSQSIAHQGVTHTRNVRMCQKNSWWADWLRKARQEPRVGRATH